MKTKNNVQKAVLRSAAVVVSLVLISFTVSAQEFWKSLLINSSFGEIALALTEDNAKSAKTGSADFVKAALLIEPEAEPILALEGWMTKDHNFGTASLQLEAEAEPALELENWMTDQSLFEPTEAPLEIEAWMVSENVW